MTTNRRSRLLAVHSWIGISSALFVYFVCFTGTASLFEVELSTWENSETQIAVPSSPIAINHQYNTWLEQLGDQGSFPLAVFQYPTQHQPYYEGWVPYRNDKTGQESEQLTRWSPIDGEQIPSSGITFFNWVSNLHMNLWSPPLIGRTLVGIAGLLLFITVVVGVFLHRQLITMMFVWQPNKSQRIFQRDSHNVLGLWGLPFHAIIAFSGVILGLNTVIGIVFGTLAFTADHHPHLEPYPGEGGPPSGIYAAPLSVDQTRDITLAHTGKEPAIVVQFNWSDRDALYRIYYETDKPMVRYGVLDLNGHNGEVINDYPTPPGPASRAFATVLPLHQGTYAGPWLKLVYSVLGLALCLLIVTGVLMWLDNRQKSDINRLGHESRTWHLMGRLTVGVCAGLPLATTIALYADQLYTFDTLSRNFYLGVTLFSTWALCIIVSFLHSNRRQTSGYLLLLCGALLAVAPLLTVNNNNGLLFNFTQPQLLAASVANIGFLISGLLTILSAWRLIKNNHQQSNTE